MNNPFYRNYYYPATEFPASARRETVPARKVIHVPVMDGSEKKRSRSRSDSAVMIQKVLRGFLVRKSVKKIAAMKTEVDELENRISSRECMDLIRKDSKERLKINEMLMRLLLKLDAVRGVDSGVRDCRKAVIRKAIRLQELVDSIAEQTVDHAPEFEGNVHESDRNPNSNPVSNSNGVDQMPNNVESQNYSEFESREDVPEPVDVEFEGTVHESDRNPNSNPISNSNGVESENYSETESREDIPEPVDGESRGNAAKSAPELNSNSNTNSPVNCADINLASQSVPDNRENEEETESNSNPNPNSNVNEQLELQCNGESVAETHGSDAESMELSQDESQTDSCANPEDLTEEDESEGGESETSEKRENGDEIERGNKEKNIELLEKLVEENEKMMGLMADLFKKNEMQTQLLSSLSHRVEHLERALMCERFRRKKKRNGTC